jgi:hypothetical protein
MPIESQYMEAFPEIYVKLLDFIKEKLLIGKSEVRLGLVINPYSETEDQRIGDMI